ncbi:MAG: hypothetical protein KatS3mg105_1392 [Gemmatales bacterium]|nr:MAG: hypothetical protein KatS3mg105_1392 [Gemmatales bacterium]
MVLYLPFGVRYHTIVWTIPTDCIWEEKNMFQRTLVILAGWLLIGPSAHAEKTKILLIGKDRDHPFRTHEYMAGCNILGKCLQQTADIETIVSNGWPKDANILEGVDAIVLYTRRGGDVLLASPARKQVEQLLKKGVGLTAIHWSTGASKQVGEDWLNVLGGWFDRGIGSRLNTTTTLLIRADPNHPVCRGWTNYNLRDEYYLDLRFHEKIHPVIQVKLDGKTHTVGWVFERPDGGRSFGFVCGHFHANFGEPAFRRAIVNGILWTAHRQVPAGGSPVKITAKDLELPPPEKKK